jgi:hypothetical protein
MIQKNVLELKKLTKKLLLLVLFLLFLFKIVGYFPIVKINQYLIYKQIEKQIVKLTPNQFLHKITISTENPNSANQIRWEKPNKDFWYNGRLYDIVRVVNTSKSTTYYCIEDKKETNLLLSFEKNSKQTDTQPTVLSWEFAKKLVTTDFPLFGAMTEKIAFVLPISKEKLQSFYSSFYQFRFISSIDFPPERL